MLSRYRIVVNRSASGNEETVHSAIRHVFPYAKVIFETWPSRSELVLEVAKLDCSGMGSSAHDIQEVLNRCLHWSEGHRSLVTSS